MKKRFLALFIVIVMLFSNISVFATDISQDSILDGTDVSTAVDDLESVYSNDGLSELIVLKEITELREANVKHFKLSNGINKAVAYSQPVHYIDESGNWIDIDNSLSLQGNEYSTNNKFEIKFANKSGSSGLLSIKDGDYKIGFTPLNTNKVNVVIENPQENNNRKFDDVKALRNLISKATYSNIYNGIDIEYILTGNNIKENIIVNSKQDSYVYSFELKLNKLTAELSNGSIILSDSITGEEMYVIPAPYMYDANGAISTHVEYSLVQNNKWKYTFTVTANAEWINTDERKFPVTIDPTIIGGYADYDTFVMSDNFDNSTMNYMIVGNYYDNDIPVFIKFNVLPEIQPGTHLVQAKLSMHISYVENKNDVDFYIGVFKATQDWISSDRFNYQTSVNYYDSSPENSVRITETGPYEWDVTSLYNQWENGTVNNGICVKSVNLPENEMTSVRISTSETAMNNYIPPRIELTYIEPKGIDDDFALLETSLGDFGNSYINLFNGNLTYILNLTTIENQILPYEINMVYNSVDCSWMASFDEKITLFENSNDVTGNNIVRYLWHDADGTVHYFTPYLQKNWWGDYVQYEEASDGYLWATNDPVVFYPEDDINYVLTKTSNGDFILKNYDGTQKYFDSNGMLTKICNSAGDMLYFYYIKQSNNSRVSPRLSSIAYKPLNGELVEQIRFGHTKQYNKLCYVYHVPTQTEINISWSTNKKIDSISFNSNDQNENHTITFTYSGNFQFLNKIVDSSTQEKINFAQDNENKYCVIQKFIDTVQNKKYKTILRNNQTTVIDDGNDWEDETDDLIFATFTFDNKGRKTKSIIGNEMRNYPYDDSILPDNCYYGVQYCQAIFYEPFDTLDDAALYFAKRYYGNSYYIRHEYGAKLYSVTYNNTTTYNFKNTVYGTPHSVSLYRYLNDNTIFVGDIHTHPFDNEYSPKDKNDEVGVGYLVIPTFQIKKFDYETQTEDDTAINFIPNCITEKEKELLQDRFEASWRTHTQTDCTAVSDCDNHAGDWPREFVSS